MRKNRWYWVTSRDGWSRGNGAEYCQDAWVGGGGKEVVMKSDRMVRFRIL